MPLIEKFCEIPELIGLSKVMLDMLTILGGWNTSKDIKYILIFLASLFPMLVSFPERSRELLISSESIWINREVCISGEESKPNNVTPIREIEESGIEDFRIKGAFSCGGIELKIV